MSINVQAIVNSNLELTDIVARWHGQAHDSHIWDFCRRRALFYQGIYGNSVLVGHAGYACSKYMMTPLAVVLTRAENLYNESQIRLGIRLKGTSGVGNAGFPFLLLESGNNSSIFFQQSWPQRFCTTSQEEQGRIYHQMTSI